MKNDFVVSNYTNLEFVGAIARDVFQTLPNSSRDTEGNKSFEDVIVCRNGRVLSYSDDARRQDLNRVRAATGGTFNYREIDRGLPLVGYTHFHEHYNIGDLPSPLQMRCENVQGERHGR